MTAKCSLITTVYNEEKSIVSFLESIYRQTRRPDEVVIVDAESKDATQSIIQRFIKDHPQFAVKLFIKKGNRSVGRNEAIRRSSHELIAATDAGCFLDKSWIESIVEPFDKEVSIDVVSGWYQPIVETNWQQSLAKTLNFKSENVNMATFLPSTRSMAFRKEAWNNVGGFDERFSHNEDTPFALELRKKNKHFIFQPKAVVYWKLVNSYRALYRTIWRYAYGDAEAHIFSSQYQIIFIFLSTVITLLVASFFLPILALFAALCFFGYLNLPFWQSKSVNSIAELWQIPLIKLTIIAANTVGYIKGTIQSKTL